MDNGCERLTWTVKEIKNGKALLLCDICTLVMPFKKEGSDNSWTNSDVRMWLNTDFYNSAFTSDEALAIIQMKIVTQQFSCEGKHIIFNKPYGKDEITTDRIFISCVGEDCDDGELLVSNKAKTDFIAKNVELGAKNLPMMLWFISSYNENKKYVYGYDTVSKKTVIYVYSPKNHALVRPKIYIDVKQYLEYKKYLSNFNIKVDLLSMKSL